MNRSVAQLRTDSLAIWQAGVDAVRGDRLVRDCVHVDDGLLWIGGQPIPIATIGRLAVVGAGKAGAGMAAGLEEALGEELMADKQLTGWVNVPEDCVRPLRRIKLHGARPARINEPTTAGVQGTEQILRLVRALSPDDVCFCLISGGGSALLPAPVDGITLADKQAITRHLSAAGANIQELNTVRKKLSRVKGGGLARACRAGRLFTLTISDVIGDPLDIIASGPTVPDPTSSDAALDILARFGCRETAIFRSVVDYLETATQLSATPQEPLCQVTHFVIGNNATAVDAAGTEAERRGYSHARNAARQLEGLAETIGAHLADMALRMRDQPGPDCLITGGEPIVKLVVDSQRGLGGRNQQLALAALERSLQQSTGGRGPLDGIVILSGGTDGEDGPTDAAGAFIDASVASVMHQHKLQPTDYLRRNDAYHFFKTVGTLLKTGPTHTNVCDLRVVVVDRVEDDKKMTVADQSAARKRWRSVDSFRPKSGPPIG